MRRRHLIALFCTAPLLACAPQASDNPLSADMRRTLQISEVQVVTSGTAFTSARAGDYSSKLSPDLRAALRREFSDRMGASGVTMQVTVSSLNVASATSTSYGRDQSRLQGQVSLVEAGQVLASYGIQTVAGEAADSRTGALLGAVTGSSGGYYRTLVDEFARDTREQILGAGLPGSRLVRNITR